MFQQARIKLTAWYILISMLVSLLFSCAMYFVIAQQLDREYYRLSVRRQQMSDIFPDRPIPEFLEPEAVQDAKDLTILNLTYINLLIFGVAGIAGYFLAGRTLRPIQTIIEEQDRFITDASHELRTPITALRSEIEVSLRERNIKSSDARELLQSNLEEVINLQVLSDNLLKLAQYQPYKKQALFEVVDCKDIASEAVRKVTPLAKVKEIEIENNVSNENLEGDKLRLTELLTIFLDNAIKYSSEKTKIIVSSKKIDTTIQISIKDQGMGIEKEDLPNIFNRFFRADNSRSKANISGYGLGLSIANQIITLHNGSVTVKSTKNVGTTFTIILPLRQPKTLPRI